MPVLAFCFCSLDPDTIQACLKMSTHKFPLAEEQKSRFELVLLGLGHGEVVQPSLRDGHVQTVGQASCLAGIDTVVERVAVEKILR